MSCVHYLSWTDLSDQWAVCFTELVVCSCVWSGVLIMSSVLSESSYVLRLSGLTAAVYFLSLYIMA